MTMSLQNGFCMEGAALELHVSKYPADVAPLLASL